MPACHRCRRFRPNLIEVSIKAGNFTVDRFDLCEKDFGELRKIIYDFVYKGAKSEHISIK